MKNANLKLLQDDSLEQVCGGGDYWGTFAGVLTAFAVAGTVKFGYDVANQSKYGGENNITSIYGDAVCKCAGKIKAVKKIAENFRKLAKD